jgi:hypothetical protein
VSGAADSSAALIGTSLDLAERAITGADLRALIEREHVLRGRYVPPPAGALEELAKAVTLLRWRVRIANGAHLTSQQRLNDGAKRLASVALQTLGDILSRLREEILAEPEAAEIFKKLRLQQLSELDALQVAVCEARQYTWLTPDQESSIITND